MDLRTYLENYIETALKGDLRHGLLEGFDRERLADSRVADRRLIYGVAYGVHGGWARSPIANNAAAWDIVETFFDRLCEYRTPEGDWLWYVPNQNKTFPHRYVFAFFSILMTVRDFGQHLDPQRLARVREAFHRPLEQTAALLNDFVETGKRNAGLNIVTAMGAALAMGAQVFDNAAWAATAKGTIARVVGRQDASGFWPDDSYHDGPATLYNAVTLAHMAEYFVATRDPVAAASIERSAQFHEFNTYADGSAVETVDERNRYHPDPLPVMLLAYASQESTRPLAARYLGALGERGLTGLSPQGMDLYGLNPDALWIDALKRTPSGLAAQPWPSAFEHTFRSPALPMRVVRSAPWQLNVAAGLRKGPARRYHYDMQQFISVFHDRLGLIVGGGGSLHDGYFSTFLFNGQYLPDTTTLTGAGQASRLKARFGSIEATLEAQLTSDGVTFTAAATSGTSLPPNSQFALHLPRRHGDTLTINGGPLPLAETAAWLDHDPAKGPLIAGPVRLACDRPLHIDWPCIPVDIYDPPKRDTMHEAVLRVHVTLSAEPTTIRLTVTP